MGKTNYLKYSQVIIIELKGFPRPFDWHGTELSTKYFDFTDIHRYKELDKSTLNICDSTGN